MSSYSNYLNRLNGTDKKKKKKKKQEQAYIKALDKYEESQKEDIAPVRTNSKAKSPLTAVKSTKATETTTKKKDDRTWFQKSNYFADGSWDKGDLTKTILGSVADVGENIGTGIIGMGEKLVDGFMQIGTAMQQGNNMQAAQNEVMWNAVTGKKTDGVIKKYDSLNKELKKSTTDFVKKDLYNEEEVAKKILTAPLEKRTGINVEASSVFGEKSDALAQSGGQLLATAGLNAVGIPWFLTTGVTTFGSEVENAYKEGATFDEATLSATISSGAEVLLEKVSGGIKFGGKTLDDIIVKPFVDKIANKFVKKAVGLGVDALGEAGEEWWSENFSRIGQWLTYQDDKSLAEMLWSEEAMDSKIEAAIGGGLLGGFANGIRAVANRNAVELTENEQKVFDKVVEDRIAEEKEDGKKVNKKKESEIRNSVLRDMLKGYIDTDTIESVLGGEEYESYKKAKDLYDGDIAKGEELIKALEEGNKKLQEEYDALNKVSLTEATLGDQNRQTQIKEKQAEIKETIEKTQAVLETLKKDTRVSDLKAKLGQNVYEIVKDSRLSESYRELGRHSQTFSADIEQYENEYAKKTVQNAIDYRNDDGHGIDNTNTSHDFIDLMTKYAAEREVEIVFTTTKGLAESKKNGNPYDIKADPNEINAFVNKKHKKIFINMDTGMNLYSLVGHEVTHTTEAAKHYGDLLESVKSFVGKKEFNEIYKKKAKTYEDYNLTRLEIEQEIVADFCGERLLTDYDFVKHLATNNQNIFQKAWDSIKHLYKMATAGSKEARDLERVKRNFEKAYRESAKSGVKVEGTQNSLSEGTTLTKEQEEYFKDSKVRDENGNLKVMYHGTPNGKFTVFDTYGSSYGLFGTGSYFTDDKSVAESYTNKGNGNGENKKVYETYLNITNPIDMDAEADVNAWAKALPEADFTNCTTNEDCYRAMEDYFEDEEYPQFEASEIATDVVQSMGYDGITHIGGGRRTGTNDTSHRVYIAFEPEQIKNIDNIAPTKDADIRYSLSDSEGKELTKEQAEYFKDSQVRWGEKLMPVYHGTREEFTEFDSTNASERSRQGGLLWVAKDYEYAKDYSFSDNPIVKKGYLNATNILDIGDIDSYGNYEKRLQEIADLVQITPSELEAMVDFKHPYIYDITSSKKFKERIVELGYDGVEAQESGLQTFGFVNSNQFKNVDNLNPTSDPDIRYSLTETDNKYLSAVKNGDTETAQRMVDEVAKENGYTIKAYHGTFNFGFTNFNNPWNFFTDDKKVASEFILGGEIHTLNDAPKDGKGVYQAYISLKNPYIIDANYKSWEEIEYNGKTFTTDEVASLIKRDLSKEYDGIIIKNVAEGDGSRAVTDYITFSSNQSKSADAITYDDNGNVIPLSERFTAENNDIRYSLTEDSEGNKLTEKQSEYFANSKAVDRNGNLLKVYHTTKNDFTVFDKARKGEATEDANTYLGFFFTDDAEYMQNFPEFENGKTESYYLDMKNPIDMTDISREAFMDIVEVMGGDVGDASILYDEELEAAHNRAKVRGDNNVSLQLGRLLDELTGEFYYDDFIRELKPHYDELMSKGYDGVINYMDELFGVKEYIVLDSHQAKLTSNENPSADADVRYSLTEDEAQETNAKLKNVGFNYDTKSGTVSYSLSSLEDAFDYKTDKNGMLVNESDYLKARNEYVDALAKSIASEKGKPTREEYKKADRYLDSLFLIHDMIAEDRERLDYEAAINRSAWVGNVEYGGSIDFSTLCAKRRLFTGTFDAIQNALPDTVLTDKDFLNIRKLLLDHGEESPCSMCYVEGSRAKHGVYVDKWLKEYLKTNPEWKPQIADFTSTTRLEQTRIQHPEAYKEYVKAMNKLSQRKPKEASVRTDYKGEILDAFKNGESVEQKNLNGGIRFNSFSDFEIIHALDCMQVLTDMARVGLNGQAYTKVKEFAEAFGNTGLKINLSLVAKDVDANGKLVMDEVNGMNYTEAKDIRSRYSDNVGTVVVVFNDAQLKAALSDSTIDYVLPFHRSQWRKAQYTLMGLPDVTRDYTNIQNDRYKNPKTGRPKKAPNGNIMPNEYWDFTKSGRENAQRYLDYINENSYIPKFDFLLNKVDGKWVLPDDAVGDGYFKLLIDFKMYNNEGVGSPQNPVLPEFNMPYIQQMLNDYVGGHKAFPVAHDVVNEFVEGKKNGKYSLSEDGETFGEYGNLKVYAKDITMPTDIAPVQSTPSVTESATASKTEQVGTVNEDDYAPMTEEQANAMYEADRGYINTFTDEDMPPEIEAPMYTADTTSIKEKSLKDISAMGRDILFLTPKERRSLEDVVQKYSTSEVQNEEDLFNEIKKLFGEKTFEERIEEVYEIQRVLKGYKINVSPSIKRDIADYTHFRRKNFGKIIFSNEGLPVDTAYMELSSRYPNFFPSDIINPSDQLQQMSDVANMVKKETQTYELDDDVIREATETITDAIGSYKEKQLLRATEKEGRAILRDELKKDKVAEQQRIAEEKAAEREAKPTRAKLHNSIVERIRTKFAEKGYDFDKVLDKAKNLSTFKTVDNIPQRVMEKALGYKQGQILADETVNKVAQNESEGIKWLNSFTDRKNGLLAQISKQYGIKPGSKKSAAAQMYAEGFYVNDKNEIVAYGDRELAIDFPNVKVQENIKGLARDERIRQIYDETLEAINESRRRNLYPEIQRLDNYFLHFRAMEDTFSRLGLPFNPNDIRAKDLPTDLNGVTADLKPGQPYFASAKHREGMRTSFDLLGGLERYLSSAKNQIYHIDDIQTLRALRNYIADTYGQAKGLESLDSLSEEEAQERIEQVYGSHLSTFAKFLNEEANVLAGKTTLIDRGLEGIIGRRGITFLNTINGQVGSNMVGWNISSSLTNFLPVAQTFAKTNKFDFTKAFAQTVSSKIGSIFGKTDSFVENNPTIIRRKGAERFYRTPFQKIGDTGYLLMSAVDNVSTELIVRTKYNELVRKGMDEQKASFEADKWASRLMGDRSLGQMPQLYNSKMLGLVTKFQLEVRNQLDSQFYDTVQEAKVSNEEIENRLLKNGKTAAKVTSVFLQLAAVQHLYGMAFESIAGYNPAFDIVEVLIKTLGLDDDEEDEDTPLDNLEEGFFALLEDLPYTSTFTGGRIPISSALPIKELIKGEDQYGNEKSRWDTIKETAPYYLSPTGYGQIKKTAQGLGMFSDEHPVSGSYTDSGSLRFPVEETPLNKIQAGVFGQYANKNARTYFDEGYAPLKEKQIQEYKDVDIPIEDYWKYREGLSGLTKLEEKADYIDSLDLPISKKNLLINNIADRKEPIDLTDYGKYDSFEEFDYAQQNPEKYAFLEKEGIGYLGYKQLDAEAKESWSWAFKHQDKYEHLKKNGVYPEDYSIFRVAMLDFDDEDNDAYMWSFDNPEKATLGSVFDNGVKEYRQYTDKLYKIKGEGAKEKKKKYIWSLPIDEGQKMILYRSLYSAKKDREKYNEDIVDYLDSREDITYDEMMTILEELDFEVDRDSGEVSWD